MGFFDKIKAGLQKTRATVGGQLDSLFSAFSRVDEEFFEELEETLILADMGVVTTAKVVETLRAHCKSEGLKDGDSVRLALKKILVEILSRGERGLKIATKPSVLLMVGVNGVGKTTTLGKLATALHLAGKQVMLCAGDTFRAAAADQLTIWAERAKAQIVKQHEGADAAAVVFDAVQAGKARGVDVILVDTAGRLHNKQNLMSELAKISRVLDRELPGCDRETLLALDATTGQNGLEQARQFALAAPLTGVVITKLDGTAKGGIAVAVADTLGVPVKYVGVGEKQEDLMPFDPVDFVNAIV
ncbi:signal recognition particle-docking protein FtsY [Clostridia bacterium]|nr:signal recognition particle-docking protein FtsY [Clostridia bacterium]